MIAEPKIKLTTKKLHLVSVDTNKRVLEASDETITTSVNRKSGIMNLGKAAVAAMNMQMGWYKLAYDSTNNILAWRIRRELDNAALQETGWKVIKPTEAGQVVISVKRILDTFPDLSKDSYKDLEIKQYKDTGTMAAQEPYYYVQVKELSDEDLNPKKNK